MMQLTSGIFGKCRRIQFYDHVFYPTTATVTLDKHGRPTWGELSCSALPAAKRFLLFPSGEW